MANCRIGNCTNDVKYHHLQVCQTCYSGLAYWRGRSVAHKRFRLEQIERLNARMEFMIENPKVHPKKKTKKKKRR